jgi:hypothetical protein
VEDRDNLTWGDYVKRSASGVPLIEETL